MITDTKIDPASHAAEKILPFGITSAVSQSNRVCARYKPGVPFTLLPPKIKALGVTATIAFDVGIGSGYDILTGGALAIDAVPEKFQLALSRYIVNSVFYEKAAATAIVFSAAHVVSASKFGCILVQISSTGVVSTKVVSSTQAYNSAPLALAALPAADTGLLAIGYIAIAAKAATWTANTDDMTNGSDLTTATFNTTSATFVSALTGTITPVAGSTITGTLTTGAPIRGSENGIIIVLMTTNGSGAITEGEAIVRYHYRPTAGSVQA